MLVLFYLALREGAGHLLVWPQFVVWYLCFHVSSVLSSTEGGSWTSACMATICGLVAVVPC